MDNLVDLLHSDRFRRKFILEGYEGGIRRQVGLFGSLSRKILLSEALRNREDQTNLNDKLFKNRRRKSKEKELKDLDKILEGNQEEWNNLKNVGKAAKMMKKKQKEQEEQLQKESEGIAVLPPQTMFNLEVVFKEETAMSVLGNLTQGEEVIKGDLEGEEKGLEDKENPGNEVMNKLKGLETDIEAVKSKNKEELELLRLKLEEQDKKIEKLDLKKQFYEEDNTRVEEEINKMKQIYHDLQKKAENLHNFLKNLEIQEKGEKDLETENSSIEKEIAQIETEWESHREGMRKAIGDFEEEVENKREKFNQIRDKLKKYDEDYEKVCNDIRSDQTQVLLQHLTLILQSPLIPKL